MRRCRQEWPAHLCAPGAMHSCARPQMHPGWCACKCGAWNRRSRLPADTPERARLLALSFHGDIAGDQWDRRQILARP